jgi:hypothetical protein
VLEAAAGKLNVVLSALPGLRVYTLREYTLGDRPLP